MRALLAPATGGERDEVKVNNASVTELKHACDDALKRVSGSWVGGLCVHLRMERGARAPFSRAMLSRSFFGLFVSLFEVANRV